MGELFWICVFFAWCLWFWFVVVLRSVRRRSRKSGVKEAVYISMGPLFFEISYDPKDDKRITKQ